MEILIAAAENWLRLDPSDRARIGPDTVATCSTAVRQLVSRLQEMGYPADPMLMPCAGVADAVAGFEASGATVPPALTEVWRQIGAISLVDLHRYGHMAFWEQRLDGDGRVLACDGVVVDGPADEAWIGYVLDLLDEQAETGRAIAIPISPDDLHKDNTSGGDGYELVADDEDPWLASLRGFSWTGPARPVSAPPGSAPDLVSYLRTAILECGGFPGLYGSASFEPLRHELIQDLPVF